MFLGLRKKTGVSSCLKKSLVGILTNNMDQWLRNWSSRAFWYPTRTLYEWPRKVSFFRRHSRRSLFRVENGKNIWIQHEIPFDMSDVNGYIKIPNWSCCLGYRACNRLTGYDDMYILENYNLVWIITDYNMKIDRLQFLMRNHYRNLCQESQSTFSATGPLISRMKRKFYHWDGRTFVLMDRDTHAGSSCYSEITDAFDSELSNHAPRSPFQRVRRRGTKYRVRFYDLDMNGHVNNSKYFGLGFEVMGADFLDPSCPLKVHLKYVKKYWQEASLPLNMNKRGLKLSANYFRWSINAQAEIEWKK